MSLRDLIQRHGAQVEFLMIYIREAHPVDGWWLGGGIKGVALNLFAPKAATDVHDPKTAAERRTVAERCENSVEMGVLTLVDEMDDSVNEGYAGWPTRLYLIGLDGRVAYAGGPGPFGFKPAELDAAITDYLARESGASAAKGDQTSRPASGRND